ncbi:hypothetical protein SS1G_04092 [Sclerotinia sclerotiorum 1980 UF-70]|uniref:MYND-type domain-containing protein n=2 Tax=Sclerotinia sclerotiorum (strain ATCC 18683 / 1980 / Ss-1) TaxID=665079 RepID=A7EFK1_SCLS1|nr:hypothetical protein SS1G_04092 [Sclerotinia sclerotiorum 1980 UF-70]APA07182.1 hypothetical protein sscle_02g019520 [Sclerotinia sclerotiorum 1980 UF-70]EDO01617.1 hypothetical protein SS1G_04092 [Sclerotinia sclerotiorum 1980 UF-70]
MAEFTQIHTFPQPMCANNDQAGDDNGITLCTKAGSKACSKCLLVQYCSKDCQAAHWKSHKKDCHSPLLKKSWKPQWAAEKRVPAFITPGGDLNAPVHEWVTMVQHGSKKYLWGNVPAIDVIQRGKNEGEIFPEEFNMLFAASGDIRNVVKSIIGLPVAYTGKCEIVINDRDFDIVARNAILLLTALLFDPMEAADIMLHTWYSAFVPESVLQKVQERILPLIEDVCMKVRDRPESSLQSKTWTFGTRKLSLTLPKASWDLLPSFLKVPSGLTASQARKVMVETTLAPSRKDYIDRAFYIKPPAWRVCAVKFRTDGILLPFGNSRKEFNTPNPTMFQSTDFWPMMDSADPKEGWAINEFMSKPPPSRNDVYGSLYFYVLKQLEEFCQRMSNLKIRFQLCGLDAMDLPGILDERGTGGNFFDRIEVSNIGDRGYLGPPKLLATFAPYLKQKSQNPHATLIALFLNAVHEYYDAHDHIGSIKAEIAQLNNYMTLDAATISRIDQETYNPEVIKYLNARSAFRDFDRPFDKFQKHCRLNEIGPIVGLKIKSKNTVVEKWPLRLKPGSAQEDFEILLASGHTGSERYVEWESLT